MRDPGISKGWNNTVKVTKMTRSTYPLRCAASSEAAAETLSQKFAERRARADLAAFDRIMNRRTGAPPRPEDELPPDLAHLGPAE